MYFQEKQSDMKLIIFLHVNADQLFFILHTDKNSTKQNGLVNLHKWQKSANLTAKISY